MKTCCRPTCAILSADLTSNVILKQKNFVSKALLDALSKITVISLADLKPWRFPQQN